MPVPIVPVIVGVVGAGVVADTRRPTPNPRPVPGPAPKPGLLGPKALPRGRGA
ncbi:MAG TPA: hypothetical protein VE760_01170 [Acidimicrobiales bacterium]|nr:hypothetical protein [Acidimicrobiales bacterium]